MEKITLTPTGPEYAEFEATLAAIPQLTLDPLTTPIAELRAALIELRRSADVDMAKSVICRPVDVEGLSGLVFQPAVVRHGAPILYFHGGAFTQGAPETQKVCCSWIAELTGRTVVSSRYRLTPENPFPAQKEDAVAALAALVAGRVPAVGKPAHVILAGESAGAAVALWAEQGAPADLRARVSHVFPIYGAFGVRDSGSIRTFGPVHATLTPERIRRMYDELGPQGDAGAVINSAPSSGPQISLLIATEDPLADDSTLLIDRLASSGRITRAVFAERMPHGFIHCAGRSAFARNVIARYLSEIA